MPNATQKELGRHGLPYKHHSGARERATPGEVLLGERIQSFRAKETHEHSASVCTCSLEEQGARSFRASTSIRPVAANMRDKLCIDLQNSARRMWTPHSGNCRAERGIGTLIAGWNDGGV